jgi:hypothetical protein
VSLYSFENEEFVFPAVHHAFRFCLLTMSGREASISEPDFVFYARQVSSLADGERHFTLSPQDFALLSPNTRTCPTFRSGRDAEIAKAIYRRVPVLVRDRDPSGNPWTVSFIRMFDMATDSGLFRDQDGPTVVPLFEAKLLHQFTHRWATYEGHETREVRADELALPTYEVTPRYWVDRQEMESRIGDRWTSGWFMAFRDITGAEKVRTVIAAALPRVAAGHNAPLLLSPDPRLPLLIANFNSFAFDWQARQKVGGLHLTFGILEQLPVLHPESYDSPTPWANQLVGEWIRPALVELLYTTSSLESLAAALGWRGGPFVWNPPRRELLRAELDAGFFHLYGYTRNDVEHVMDSFWVVRDKDVKASGYYRTKALILETYDAMAEASDTRPFVSKLEPKPGDASQAHPAGPDGPIGRWTPWHDVDARSSVQDSTPGDDFTAPDSGVPPGTPSGARPGTNSLPLVTASPDPRFDRWSHEDAVDRGEIQSGTRVRHRTFGQGTVVNVREWGRSATILIRFASGEREISFGYGLLEFRMRS